MLQIYSNIKKKRKELGYTQTELAHKLGYADKSMIAKIEKGQIDLSQSKIMAFAKALNTTASELMGNDGVVVESKAPSSEFILTDHERDHIEMYRDLDNIGQHTVDAVTRVEHERAMKEKK